MSVLVTGLGAVAAAGPSLEAIWEAVLSGRSGIGPIRQWNAQGWPCGIAGEIPGFDPRALVSDRKLHKLISRCDLLGLNAAQQALADSGLLAHRDGLGAAERTELNERTAVVTASGGGNYQNQYDYFPLLSRAGGELRRFGEELTSTVSPMWLLRTLPNNVLCYAGVSTGFKGPNANFTSHSAGGGLAILEAARLLEDGEADRALVIGYDTPVEPEIVLHFARLGLLASTAIRSFDARRDGSLLGEGAAALLLETSEAAARRGARPRGEVLGGAVTSEAGGLLALGEDGDGVVRALRQGLLLACVEPGEVALVAAHANGTLRSDLSEGRALLEVFGGQGPPVTGFKWAVGHLISASGAMETALTMLALQAGLAPGIPTLEELDPELEGLAAGPHHRPLSASGTAVVVGRGFAGTAVSVVVRGARPEGA